VFPAGTGYIEDHLMAVIINYNVPQMEKVIAKMEAMGIAAEEARPAMLSIALIMMQALRKNFDAQGRRGGGSWKRDSDAWLARKISGGLDPRIGFATHKLVDSLSTPGAQGQRVEVTNTAARIISVISYAQTEEEHRPYIKWTLGDRREMAAAARRHIMDAFRAANA
jgi:phage gpG-like protein